MSAKFKTLEECIFSQDADHVVEEVSGWSEEDRQAAWEDINVLGTAVWGRLYIPGLPPIAPDDPRVIAKRKERGVDPKDRKMQRRDVWFALRLAQYALASQQAASMLADAYEEKFIPYYVRVMIDRRPPWIDEWHAATLEENPLHLAHWCMLFNAGVLNKTHLDAYARVFVVMLPEGLSAFPDDVKQVIRAEPQCLELFYDLDNYKERFFEPDPLCDAVGSLARSELLDVPRYLESLLTGLHGPYNQTERNGCAAVIRALAREDAGLAAIASCQTQVGGLAGDPQSSIAGLAVELLAMMEKAGTLDDHEAIAALPSVFSHKPKKHAVGALSLLERAGKRAGNRDDALQAIAKALMHSNKEVQSKAMKILAKAMSADDTQLQSELEMYRDSVPSTLSKTLEGLIDGSGLKSSSKPRGGKKTAAQAKDDATPAKLGVVLPPDLLAEADSLSSEVRRLFRVEETLAAAESGTIDFGVSWQLADIRTADVVAGLEPIEAVEELVDVASAAVERCESSDDAERMVAAIARLHQERPDNFDMLTQALKKRVSVELMRRPMRGILGAVLGSAYSQLIQAWLGVDPDPDEMNLIGHPLASFLESLAERIRTGKGAPLYSEATHVGGWIAPDVWLGRLELQPPDPESVFLHDLVHSLLRLMPEGREEAWNKIRETDRLSKPAHELASVVLGGELKIFEHWPPEVWIAAVRSRFPAIDLLEHMSEAERQQLDPELLKLPDVIRPSNYDWKSLESGGSQLVRSHPMGEVDEEQLLAEARDQSTAMEWLQHLTGLLTGRSSLAHAGGHLTGRLHFIRSYGCAGYYYPLQASYWPAKLDWYWAQATEGLARRLESKASVEDPFGFYLVPLLERNRPLTKMAARALWIATATKDEHSRAIATDCWIAIIEEDRADIPLLTDALVEVSAGGWVKANRIAEMFVDVSACSGRHGWFISELLAAYLSRCDKLPRNGHQLLEVMDESCERLGLAASPCFVEPLQKIKSGKAKPLAKSLLSRSDVPSDARQEAIHAAVAARVANAKMGV